MNKQQVIAAIVAYVKTNANNEITGDGLQGILLHMIGLIPDGDGDPITDFLIQNDSIVIKTDSDSFAITIDDLKEALALIDDQATEGDDITYSVDKILDLIGDIQSGDGLKIHVQTSDPSNPHVDDLWFYDDREVRRLSVRDSNSDWQVISEERFIFENERDCLVATEHARSGKWYKFDGEWCYVVTGNTELKTLVANWDDESYSNDSSKKLSLTLDGETHDIDCNHLVVSMITSMNKLFKNSSFNQNINMWDVSGVENMDSLFDHSDFNQIIENWDVSNVRSMEAMFYFSSFNHPLRNWDVSKVRSMKLLFRDSPFNQDISRWDVSSVEDMTDMFYNTSFNRDIGDWDVSNVRYMTEMFENNSVFNQDISLWDVSRCVDMKWMFYRAISFNQDISPWNVENVTDMTEMFGEAYSFDQDLSGWCVKKITSEPGSFASQAAFNNDPEKHPDWGHCPCDCDSGGGFDPKTDGDGSKFLDDQGNYSTPPTGKTKLSEFENDINYLTRGVANIGTEIINNKLTISKDSPDITDVVNFDGLEIEVDISNLSGGEKVYIKSVLVHTDIDEPVLSSSYVKLDDSVDFEVGKDQEILFRFMENLVFYRILNFRS